MKKNIDEFIKENRHSFDDREPSEKNWNRISATLFSQQGLWNSLVLWRSAAALFIAVSAWLFISKTSVNPEKQIALQEFNAVESFYADQISEKVKLINDYREENGLNGYTHDFKQLEAMYYVLKEEMKARPSQKVKDALVLNLLVRIDLLNKQLHHLEEDRAEETGTNDEGSNT